MKKRFLIILSVLTICVCFIVGCELDNKPIEVSSVALDKSQIEMEVGEKITLIATVSPDNATDKSLTWSIADTSIATVIDGEVTAISAGETTLTVMTVSGEYTATCEIKVNESASTLTSKVYKFYCAKEYEMYVGMVADFWILPEDKFVLTLNSDNTCTLTYRAAETTTITYTGTYQNGINGELTLTVVSDYDGNTSVFNATIEGDDVLLPMNGGAWTAILKDVEAERVPFEINEIVGEYVLYQNKGAGSDSSASLELKEDKTFTFLYEIAGTLTEISGTWSHTEAGKITLNDTSNNETTEIIINDGKCIGIWVENSSTYFYLKQQTIVGTYFCESFDSNGITYKVGDDINDENMGIFTLTEETFILIVNEKGGYRFIRDLSDVGIIMDMSGTYTKNAKGEYEFSSNTGIIGLIGIPEFDSVVCEDGHITIDHGVKIKLKKKSNSTDVPTINKYENQTVVEKYNFLRIVTSNGECRGDKLNILSMDGEKVYTELNENTSNFIMYENNEALFTFDCSGVKIYVHGSYTSNATNIVFDPYMNIFGNIPLTKNGEMISIPYSMYSLDKQTFVKDKKVITEEQSGKYYFYAGKRETSDGSEIIKVGDYANNGTIIKKDDFVVRIYEDGVIVVKNTGGTVTVGTFENDNGTLAMKDIVYASNNAWDKVTFTITDNIMRVSDGETTMVFNKEGTTVSPDYEIE